VRLKRLLADVDPQAFVTIAPVKEVIGEGFTPLPADHET